MSEIAYSVPDGSFNFWIRRFEENKVVYNKPSEKFGEPYITFLDFDRLKVELTVSKSPDNRKPWVTHEVNDQFATKGFYHATLALVDIKPTADILTEVFGYRLSE